VVRTKSGGFKVVLSVFWFLHFVVLVSFLPLLSVIEIETIFLLFTFALYRPFYAIALFLFLVLVHSLGLLTFSGSFLLALFPYLLVALYTRLFFKNKIKLKKFLVKLDFHSIVLILIYFYVLSLLIGLVGQPLYSFAQELFSTSYLHAVTEVINSKQSSALYPLKTTFVIVESILLGLYIFGASVISKKVKEKKEKLHIFKITSLVLTLVAIVLLSQTVDIDTTMASRTKQWDMATHIIMLNPLYGTGFDSIEWKLHKLGEEQIQIDNLYLKTILGSGFVGFIFFISMLFILLYRLILQIFYAHFSDSSIKIVNIFLFVALIFVMIYANFTNLFSSYLGIVSFWMLIFIVLSITYTNSVKHIEQLKTKDFFQYMNVVFVYLMVLQFLNYTAVKKYIAKLLDNTIFHIDDTALITYLIIVGTLGVIGSVVIHWATIFLSNSNNIWIDRFGKEKSHAHHDTYIARAGGIGVFLVNLFLLFNPIGIKLLFSSVAVFLVGLLDDLRPISSKVRLFFQALSALIVMYMFHFQFHYTLFGMELPQIFAFCLSFVVFIGVVNAMNIIDGLNGLVGWTSLMIFTSLGVVTLSFEDIGLFEIVFINIMALIGFLVMNFPNAKIFLGDGGAYLLGFIISVVSLLLLEYHSEVSILYPVALLIYPIWEVVYSIYRRTVVEKKECMLADNMHMHQILLRYKIKNNPKTTLYIVIRLFPFMVAATYFYDNDIALFLVIGIFVFFYNATYKQIVKMKSEF